VEFCVVIAKKFFLYAHIMEIDLKKICDLSTEFRGIFPELGKTTVERKINLRISFTLQIILLRENL